MSVDNIPHVTDENNYGLSNTFQSFGYI